MFVLIAQVLYPAAANTTLVVPAFHTSIFTRVGCGYGGGGGVKDAVMAVLIGQVLYSAAANTTLVVPAFHTSMFTRVGCGYGGGGGVKDAVMSCSSHR